MGISVKAILSPNENHILKGEEAMIFCGQCLNMCYLKDDFEQIRHEPTEKSIKRAKDCLEKGHHSAFEHVKYTFVIEEIPKIFAMILNNQSVYATSEKSARYTVMELDGREKELREKWEEIFTNIITEKYADMFYRFYSKPDLPEEKIEKKVKNAIRKKALENARNITSVFTKTKMVYTINLRQLSYLRYELKTYIKDEENTPFNIRLKKVMQEFLDETKIYGLEEEGLNPSSKGIKLPFFDTISERKEEFGQNYSMNYMSSISAFAQNQRHRTIHCLIQIPEEKTYVTPDFLKDENLRKEWISDLRSVTSEDDFPQALMIKVNERGRYEDFILKCYERLCGAAQQEITMLTKQMLNRYLENVTDDDAKKALEKINSGARCTFGFKCKEPCVFGAKNALDRDF